jgi:peptidoglycan/LPS O-acetylase OafA/YrhL
VTAARGPESMRLPGLDGVRGAAMALVFVHHVVVRDRDPLIDGGWIGVDLFFVLSGFLITMSMLTNPDLGDFLRRRFWRIAPAMAVFLLAYVVWSIGAADEHQRMSWAFAAATQWANVQGAMGPPFSPHIGHLWSLSAEVQFYVLWGMCLWWMLRRSVPRPVVLGVVIVLFVLSWAERVLLLDAGTLWNRLYLGPDTRAAGLLVGCALGLAHASGWLRQRRVLTALVLPAVAVMTWFVVELTFLDGRTYRWGLTVAALAWGVVVASAALRLPTPIRPLLEARPLVWLGRISYSVYLWHLAIIAEVAADHPDDPVAVALIAAPITLVVGWVSYRIVERPLLSASGRARVRARVA